MRFDLDQRFAVPPAEVLAALTDPALHRRPAGHSRVEPVELRGIERDGNDVVVRVRYRFTADLPGAATAVVDPDKLTWVEETRYDLIGLTSATTLLPDHYADRLTASATSRLTDGPEGPGRTVRHISGEVTVRVPLVGGRVERAIVDGLREHLAEQARLVGEHVGGTPDG